eukprot:282402-Rhodomonas_salina.3
MLSAGGCGCGCVWRKQNCGGTPASAHVRASGSNRSRDLPNLRVALARSPPCPRSPSVPAFSSALLSLRVSFLSVICSLLSSVFDGLSLCCVPLLAQEPASPALLRPSSSCSVSCTS